MIKLTLLTLCVILFTSCLTQKKLKSHAVRYYAEHPGELARKCAKEYPAKVTAGDTIRSTDTTVLPGLVLPCPDREDINGKVVNDYVQCPPNKIIRDQVFVHDTLIDVAAVTAMAVDTATLGAEYRAQTAKLVQTTVEKEKALKQARNRLFALIGIALFAGVALIIAIKNVLV